jgi:NADH:ubiquinone oxidoreductase subunit 4 (subunit M)
LIPTLFLILAWGYQPERVQAGIYLLFYRLLASLPLLVGSRKRWQLRTGLFGLMFQERVPFSTVDIRYLITLCNPDISVTDK